MFRLRSPPQKLGTRASSSSSDIAPCKTEPSLAVCFESAPKFVVFCRSVFFGKVFFRQMCLWQCMCCFCPANCFCRRTSRLRSPDPGLPDTRRHMDQQTQNSNHKQQTQKASSNNNQANTKNQQQQQAPGGTWRWPLGRTRVRSRPSRRPARDGHVANRRRSRPRAAACLLLCL